MHMAVRKSGSKFFPVKKNGTLWKTGFSSQAKAEAAIRQNKARLSKLTGKSGGGGGGGRKPAGNPSPASNSSNSKGMTHGKFMKGFSFAGAGIDVGLKISEGLDVESATIQAVRDYSGVDIQAGTFEPERLAKGWGGPVFNKVENFIFKGAGVSPPSLKRKGIRSKVQLGVYHAAAIANASGGNTPREKFLRFYRSHYGVDLTKEKMDALDYSKPIVEKVIPYILVTKLMQFIK